MRHTGIFLLLVVLGGCASTLHPERVNQPPENRGSVDLLSAVGDLAVPGGSLLLIYDIHNGAIYNPKNPSASPAPSPKPNSGANLTPPAQPPPPKPTSDFNANPPTP